MTKYVVRTASNSTQATVKLRLHNLTNGLFLNGRQISLLRGLAIANRGTSL